ncbi:hypothetical protein COT29_00860 [Candidatus Micrarchaeota archaeon CG08_land_8_20_14_0_20_59_11]|nr:MAG: hypothetical protein COT29_00860 [Candidatus Micrarchaeota archaeon CG08_land_8_20_14_0_20_59_11]PIT85906.1 MAG: hypothetical protein COU36_00640 [Candidatus Micrarchaeota archaeon CG10_big_fil_rev_8_21_14_0_10_59_7]
MKKVVVCGAFDPLHLGHVRLLKKAKERGRLYVVVARDGNIRRIKKREPFYTEKERMEFLKEMRCIDEVVLGEKSDLLSVLRRIKPDVVVLGYDQKADLPAIRRAAPKALVVREKRLSRHKSSEKRKVIRWERY